MDKTVEGEVLDSLGLNKYCCRRHMLTHVDIE
jgi:DNA-directed RNA polymerase I, II, and III subunit RPABC5